MELEMDCLTLVCTKVCASSSSYDVMAGQNIKKKYLVMCQISIKMLKQHTDIQFQTHFYITQRLIHQKGAEKLVKDELYMM